MLEIHLLHEVVYMFENSLIMLSVAISTV